MEKYISCEELLHKADHDLKYSKVEYKSNKYYVLGTKIIFDKRVIEVISCEDPACISEYIDDASEMVLVLSVYNDIPSNFSNNPWDKQEGGDHYKYMKIQPMQYSLANKLNAAQHTAIKYITRYKDKSKPVEDLRKAIHTIELLIKHEEEKCQD